MDDGARPDAGAMPDLGVRADYDPGAISLDDLGDDPVAEARIWLAEAQGHIGVDFNAMVLATVDAHGAPSTRNVLLREIDQAGRFSFFTNRLSHKGIDIAGNASVSLLFTWLSIRRQVRVDGTAEVLGDAVCDEYFAGRPRDSQLAAWASEQSAVIPSRQALLDAVARYEHDFTGREVPRPPHWGGYSVNPHMIEFWQGRPSRLHDRIRFRRPVGADPELSPDAAWVRERLAP